MDPEIETKHVTAVEMAIHSIYKAMFPQADRAYVPQLFQWTTQIFSGNYRDYQAIDALYHDLEHTLQGTLCMARLLHGYQMAKASPELTQRQFELGMIAILLHDTGYLKKRADTEGTGAKYTSTHVLRSIDFAKEFLEEKDFSPTEIKSVQNMIRCTGVNIDLGSVPFQNELEKKVGLALGTADLVGQMAAKDYVQKLPTLYAEFAEAAAFSKTTAMFSSAEDLLHKTPGFWEKYVVPKINGDFQGLHNYLRSPFPDGPNFYVARIQINISAALNLIKERAATNSGPTTAASA